MCVCVSVCLCVCAFVCLWCLCVCVSQVHAAAHIILLCMHICARLYESWCLHVLHTEDKSFINRRTDFALYTSSRGRHLKNIGTISQSSGTPIFEIFVANKEK